MRRGPGIRKGQKLGPMKDVVDVLIYSRNIFQPHRVKLECGHEASVWSTVRAHCKKCRQEGDR
jgi:hypothetical protein